MAYWEKRGILSSFWCSPSASIAQTTTTSTYLTPLSLSPSHQRQLLSFFFNSCSSREEEDHHKRRRGPPTYTLRSERKSKQTGKIVTAHQQKKKNHPHHDSEVDTGIYIYMLAFSRIHTDASPPPLLSLAWAAALYLSSSPHKRRKDFARGYKNKARKRASVCV